MEVNGIDSLVVDLLVTGSLPVEKGCLMEGDN